MQISIRRLRSASRQVGRVTTAGESVTPGSRARSEGVSGFRVAEQPVHTGPIKAQSAAVAPATASICNAEWGRVGGMSGHVGSVHTFSGTAEAVDRELA